MRRTLFAILLALGLAPAAGLADSVVPSDQLQSRLNVREAAAGPVIGGLLPGERATYVATRGAWHQIELADGRVGFVSAAWSRVVPEPEPAASMASTAHLHVERSGLRESVRGFFRDVRTWLGLRPRVDLVLRDPVRDGAIHEHDDPLLPVAGLATPEGSSGTYEIVLVLDASASTHGFSEADVNGDGRLDDTWQGPDSIYQAQIRAAREFVAALGRLPYNRGGQRIRVAVVSFAGDEDAASERFDPSPAALLRLSRLDAEERVPLSADYARVDRELDRLASREPTGSTDFAAGVGRALATLGVLTSDATSEDPHSGAQKAILFLTDGKPQLPVERKTAERAALYASRLAGEAGVRIHTYSLGWDVVRRGVNPVLRRMARQSGGRFTQLQTPGEIVALLRSTSFSFVSSVRLANATRGDEIAEIATAIDGSFYGELPLAEGANEIEVEVVLNDGRRSSRKLTITWVDTKPIKALESRLAALREENAALVEQLREKLTREIQTVRSREARDLTISVAK
jgi:Mg-chelatase subunit ChlD